MLRNAIIVGLAIVAVLACVFLGKTFGFISKRVRETLSNLQFSLERETNFTVSSATTQIPSAGSGVQPRPRITENEIAELCIRLANQIQTFDEIVPVLGPPSQRRSATKSAAEQLTYANLNPEYDVCFERTVEGGREGIKVLLVPKNGSVSGD